MEGEKCAPRLSKKSPFSSFCSFCATLFVGSCLAPPSLKLREWTHHFVWCFSSNFFFSFSLFRSVKLNYILMIYKKCSVFFQYAVVIAFLLVKEIVNNARYIQHCVLFFFFGFFSVWFLKKNSQIWHTIFNEITLSLSRSHFKKITPRQYSNIGWDRVLQCVKLWYIFDKFTRIYRFFCFSFCERKKRQNTSFLALWSFSSILIDFESFLAKFLFFRRNGWKNDISYRIGRFQNIFRAKADESRKNE